MEQPSLFERVGGDAGVDAIARALHRRVDADPVNRALVDDARVADIVDADARALAHVLDGRHGERRTRPGALLSRPSVGVRHLRDALWLLGFSSALVDEVMVAVVSATPVQAG